MSKLEGVINAQNAAWFFDTGKLLACFGIPNQQNIERGIANVLLLILATLAIPLFVRVVRIPYSILMPLIVVFCVTGAYSLKNNLWDVGMMLVFGVIGYFMKKLGYSPAALVLALVLGPLAERALRQSLIISDAGIGILFMRPISGVLTALALLAIAVPVVRALWSRGQTPTQRIRA